MVGRITNLIAVPAGAKSPREAHFARQGSDGFCPGKAAIEEPLAALLARRRHAVGAVLHLVLKDLALEFQTTLADRFLHVPGGGGRILAQGLQILHQMVNPWQELLGNRFGLARWARSRRGLGSIGFGANLDANHGGRCL